MYQWALIDVLEFSEIDEIQPNFTKKIATVRLPGTSVLQYLRSMNIIFR